MNKYAAASVWNGNISHMSRVRAWHAFSTLDNTFPNAIVRPWETYPHYFSNSAYCSASVPVEIHYSHPTYCIHRLFVLVLNTLELKPTPINPSDHGFITDHHVFKKYPLWESYDWLNCQFRCHTKIGNVTTVSFLKYFLSTFDKLMPYPKNYIVSPYTIMNITFLG